MAAAAAAATLLDSGGLESRGQVRTRSSYSACASLLTQQRARGGRGARRNLLSKHTQGCGGASDWGRRSPQWKPLARERPQSGFVQPLLGPGSAPLGGERLEVPKRGLYAGLAPNSDKFPHLTTRVLFLPLHLLLDRSWWCHDSAPQGAGSAGSYIPRSGGGLRMPSQMEDGVPSLWRFL